MHALTDFAMTDHTSRRAHRLTTLADVDPSATALEIATSGSRSEATCEIQDERRALVVWSL